MFKRYVVTLSGGLVSLSDSGQIELIHQSLREFLLGEGLIFLYDSTLLNLTSVRFCAEIGHAILAKVCSTCIVKAEAEVEASRVTDVWGGTSVSLQAPCLWYAISSLSFHLKESQGSIWDILPMTELEKICTVWTRLMSNHFRDGRLVCCGRETCSTSTSTLLHIAAAHGADCIVRCALRHGSTPSGALLDGRDGKGRTALHLATYSGNLETMGILISSGACVDYGTTRENLTEDHSLHSADMDHLRPGKLVYSGSTPLIIAVETRSPTKVKLLIRSGADIDLDDRFSTPLMYAIRAEDSGYVEIIECLLYQGAKLNILNPLKHGTALSLACRQLDLSLVKSLLTRGANPDGHPHALQSPFAEVTHTVTFWGSNESRCLAIINLLFEHGANPTSAAASDLLANAVIKGPWAVKKALTDLGARLDPDRVEGCLRYVCYLYDSPTQIEWLAAQIADLEARSLDIEGDRLSAMEFAMSGIVARNPITLRRLGAMWPAQGFLDTSQRKAAKTGKVLKVAVLLMHGANPSALEHSGLAQDNDNNDALQLCLQRVSDPPSKRQFPMCQTFAQVHLDRMDAEHAETVWKTAALLLERGARPTEDQLSTLNALMAKAGKEQVEEFVQKAKPFLVADPDDMDTYECLLEKIVDIFEVRQPELPWETLDPVYQRLGGIKWDNLIAIH